jgi:hypothetical protein
VSWRASFLEANRPEAIVHREVPDVADLAIESRDGDESIRSLDVPEHDVHASLEATVGAEITESRR